MTRIHAYVLVADPSFLAKSIGAYYRYVDKIVLSFDRTATSWTGTPLPVRQCLDIIATIDHEGKCVHAPGDFARLDHSPFDNETYQRQVALDLASEGADWVVQLDTDEVMLSSPAFFASLAEAGEHGFAGLHYPALWLYTRAAPGRYLERTSRWWRRTASYPGPLAVRAGTRLHHARQAEVDLYRVDVRRRNTDPWQPADAVVHRAISPSESVAHFSWVRDAAAIRRKLGWSGHVEELKPPAAYRKWVWRTRHPYLCALGTPARRGDDGWYRVTRIPEPPGGEPPVINVDGHSDGTAPGSRLERPGES